MPVILAAAATDHTQLLLALFVMLAAAKIMAEICERLLGSLGLLDKETSSSLRSDSESESSAEIVLHRFFSWPSLQR